MLLFVQLLFIAIDCFEPNPPSWPPTVYIFEPGDDDHTQFIVDDAFEMNGGSSTDFHGQWSDQRYAFLFLPGTHNVDVNVGYYTTVMGLGANPQDTRIRNVISSNGSPTAGALSNFWRNAENFMTTPTKTQNNRSNTMMWAVSQGVSLRSVIVNGNLDLYEATGATSGGFLSNSYVSGVIHSGTQQQWYTRNTKMKSWDGGNWNIVYQGLQNTPNSMCHNRSTLYYTLKTTPIIAEKPFIAYQNDKYYLQIPAVELEKVGPTDFQSATNMKQVDFKHVYVTDQSEDNATSINDKISSGCHIVLTAGEYQLSEAIKVTRSNVTILGIGFPTLISMNGNILIDVADGVEGVRISGILYQAGPIESPVLLRFGTNKAQSAAGHNFLYDTFVRVGGPNDPRNVQYKADTMVQINSNNVVMDNSWLWRADHDVTGNVFNSSNPVKCALQVNGDHVIAYSLKVEHTLATMAEWFGDHGAVYMFQSEFPYDGTEQYGKHQYNAFKVGDNVTTFDGYGMGMYTYFRDHPVVVENAIQSPKNVDGIHFTNLYTIWLWGDEGTEITHVINGLGAAVNYDFRETPSAVCRFP